MEDQIITLLKNSELRTKISQVMREIYKDFGTFYDDPEYNPDYMRIVTEEDRFNEVWVDAQLSTEGEVGILFRNCVFKKLPLPHRIHFDEVLEILFDMARPDARGSLCRDCKYADSAYASFVNYVNNHVLSYRYSTPFPVCTIRGGEEQQGVYEGTLWSSDAGVSLWLVGRSGFKSRVKGSFHVMTQITGRMSETACKELSGEFERIVPSMWRSVKALGGETLYELDTTASRLKVPTLDESNLPVISEVDFENGKTFVQKCIDAYFSTPTKKDSFDRRIRNAVHLLVASDAQSNGAVGLALSVAAIEALLGENVQGTSQRLADNVAALLEPELPKRQKATEFVKHVYDKRSRVLHGDEIEDREAVRLQGRRLAAGVLHAIITRRDFLKACGFDPQRPQQFLKDLYEKRFEPGQPVGLLESNVRELWSYCDQADANE